MILLNQTVHQISSSFGTFHHETLLCCRRFGYCYLCSKLELFPKECKSINAPHITALTKVDGKFYSRVGVQFEKCHHNKKHTTKHHEKPEHNKDHHKRDLSDLTKRHHKKGEHNPNKSEHKKVHKVPKTIKHHAPKKPEHKKPEFKKDQHKN